MARNPELPEIISDEVCRIHRPESCFGTFYGESTVKFRSYSFHWKLQNFSLGSYAGRRGYLKSFTFPDTVGGYDSQWSFELTADRIDEEDNTINATLFAHLEMAPEDSLLDVVPAEFFVSVSYCCKDFPLRRVCKMFLGKHHAQKLLTVKLSPPSGNRYDELNITVDVDACYDVPGSED